MHVYKYTYISTFLFSERAEPGPISLLLLTIGEGEHCLSYISSFYIHELDSYAYNHMNASTNTPLSYTQSSYILIPDTLVVVVIVEIVEIVVMTTVVSLVYS